MNPFDDPDGEFLVVADDEEQHFVWPGFAAVPEGWSVRFGPDSRAACLACVAAFWTDPRPRGPARAPRP
ncbi:MbtH family protein [Nonomuraea sp. PA05]|uniref:MbtH family protein n=1 Tax=Nonomuraea sp. PA05 TaxID=2604466 RepID=UPI0011D7CE07|nr:MbtH family protein [Nonomuraea sp. PA05]TYB46059.1 MbtH family protein [Nonomuraea sp. PA05]